MKAKDSRIFENNFNKHQIIDIMAIYTKKGDSGETSLVGGERVSKASDRVNAYGDIDELISWLGYIRSSLTCQSDFLRNVQCVLMSGSAWVASQGDCPKLAPFDATQVKVLEQEIDRMTSEMPKQTAFILPSAPQSASVCHIARTVCRRAERSTIGLNDGRENVQNVVKYLNRLSDYLFTLGRYCCYKENIAEDFWLV